MRASDPIGAALAGLVEQAVCRALDARADDLADRVAARLRTDGAPAAEPLAEIIGGTPARARMMEARHPDLRALSIGTVGRRRVYRRADVERWIASRGPVRLRAGGGVE